MCNCLITGLCVVEKPALGWQCCITHGCKYVQCVQMMCEKASLHVLLQEDHGLR